MGFYVKEVITEKEHTCWNCGKHIPIGSNAYWVSKNKKFSFPTICSSYSCSEKCLSAKKQLQESMGVASEKFILLGGAVALVWGVLSIAIRSSQGPINIRTGELSLLACAALAMIFAIYKYWCYVKK